ncbi:lycopene cyclase domain-containing protein [Halobaculum sp. CBA1158]|uniref:lycopene cyclase domain-containing protein n=1 Tax=Halobaculum sp. CBA1158 TaxID=2904243 RepID=UPI001F43574A|nr:lycopene cyclase domain-containing protein [Halobaculum sp. CBA1158]UIP00127.1 lycopene cyclase domain-containing protein [Halobaculum sp. CBA1158]
MTLSYLAVHLLFVVPPIAALWALARLRPPFGSSRRRRARAGLALMCAVAVAYTTPWDNLLIERGVWFYGEGRVLARVWAAPVGEYLFFVLQTLLVGLWLDRVGVDAAPFEGDLARRPRVAGTVAWLAVAAAGGWLLLAAPERYTYLGALLAWVAPVAALQWGVGGAVLARPRATPRWLLAVAVPSLYLAAVDRVAIGDGVWTIAPETATGVAVAGLPVEEALFFASASLLVVQGLVLFEWAARRWVVTVDADADAGASRRPGDADEGFTLGD